MDGNPTDPTKPVDDGAVVATDTSAASTSVQTPADVPTAATPGDATDMSAGMPAMTPPVAGAEPSTQDGTVTPVTETPAPAEGLPMSAPTGGAPVATPDEKPEGSA